MERAERIEKLVLQCVQETLGGNIAVERNAPLMDLGIDSIAAVALRGV